MLDLTKWPRLLVTGAPVTREQANDILIRTDDIALAINNNSSQWNTKVAHAFGLTTPLPSYSERNDTKRIAAFRAHHEEIRIASKTLGTLRLRYLGNRRIASSWIGGAHGWCDWSGNITADTFNIGKWPGVEEVTEDWQTIATAFPYLNLTAQAITEEGEGELAAQWRVKDGHAVLQEPGKQILPVEDPDIEMQLMEHILNEQHERGVPLERLVEAIIQVRASQAR